MLRPARTPAGSSRTNALSSREHSRSEHIAEAPGYWWESRRRQQRRDSRFTAAMNVPPNPPGPSYTSISTQVDTVATPSTEVAPLEGASNILIQDLCPQRPVDHVGMLGDAVTYRLDIDALTNPGPTDPARAGVNCGEVYMPGADVAAIPGAVASYLAAVAATPFDPNNTAGEPALRCYLDPACPANTSGDR